MRSETRIFLGRSFMCRLDGRGYCLPHLCPLLWLSPLPPVLPRYLSLIIQVTSVIAMLIKTSGISSVTANVVGTEVDDAEGALLALAFRFGHSFFQYPFLRHSRQEEFAILLASVPLPLPLTFPSLPPPFSPFLTDQKARNRTFSDSLFRASW